MDEDILDRAMSLPGAKRYANYVACICPFHSDSFPSLLVYKDWYRCTACDAQGRPEKLFNSVSPIGWKASPDTRIFPSIPKGISKEVLAYRAHRALIKNGLAQKYIQDRGVWDMVGPCKIGYWDGWYTIPIFNRDQDVTNIMFRASPQVQGKSSTRFYQLGGQGKQWYCPDWKQYDHADVLVIPFGLFDAITISYLGFGTITPIIGKYNFDPRYLDQWRKPIIILPDHGEERAANKLAAEFRDWRPRVLVLPYRDVIHDPNDFAREGKLDELEQHLRDFSRASPRGAAESKQCKGRRLRGTLR